MHQNRYARPHFSPLPWTCEVVALYIQPSTCNSKIVVRQIDVFLWHVHKMNLPRYFDQHPCGTFILVCVYMSPWCLNLFR